METSKIEEKIYQSLKSDENLIEKLAEKEKSIFHIQAPAQESTKYPCIVYDLISCPPYFWSDDLVKEYLASFRIWILTKDGNDEIADDIQRIMENLGAARYQTAKYRENKEIIKIMDYRLRVRAEPENEDTIPAETSTECTCPCCSTDTTKLDLMTIEDVDKMFERWSREDNVK